MNPNKIQAVVLDLLASAFFYGISIALIWALGGSDTLLSHLAAMFAGAATYSVQHAWREAL